MSRTIIVSDLHVDTWINRKIRATGKSKKEHFFDLLDWCEKVQIRELVINGDLMDLPPYSGNIVFAQEDSPAREVVERLVDFGSRIKITYVYGNHDIGISGLRCLGENSIQQLRNVNFCYPNYRIDYPSSTILIEHGHFCDPALMLYVRDLANFTYRRSKFEAFMWTMQRRDRANPEKFVAPGLLKKVDVTPGENAYQAAKRMQEPLPKATLWQHIKEALWLRGNVLLGPPKDWWWWKKAQDEMREFIDEKKSSESLRPVLYQIYGHTHSADPRDPVVYDNTKCIYINAGTWTEEADNGWYLDVDCEGKVWLQDWINEPESLRKL